MSRALLETEREATRARIRDAALKCIERWGLSKTSLEDVASAARLSRATVYRYFPGGRDELVHETVIAEVQNFFERLEQTVYADQGIEAKLEHGLMAGHRALGEHRLLQQVLSTDRDALLVELADLGPLMLGEVRREMRDMLAAEDLRAGVDPEAAADYVARLFLSYLTSSGGHDLDDAEAVRTLVRRFFIGGIVRSPDQ